LITGGPSVVKSIPYAPLLDDILGVRQANIEQTVVGQVGLNRNHWRISEGIKEGTEKLKQQGE
jgi:hypothetical protein